MRKYIVASHHKFAYGLKCTLEFLTGEENVYDISAYVDDTALEKQIEKCFENIKDNDTVFIFTDMLGGSVNQKFFPYMSDKVHLICGVNVPLVLSIVLQAEEDIKAGKIQDIIDECKSQMIYMNKYELEDNQEDE